MKFEDKYFSRFNFGGAMRSKRNIGMYSGGIDITDKESLEYVDFVGKIIAQVKILLNL